MFYKNFISLLGDGHKARILDYGCGQGNMLKFLCDSDVNSICAVDADTKALNKVKKRFPQEIKKGFLFPFLASSPRALHRQKFNKIICHNVLECIEHKIEFINDFEPLLSPNGIFLLSHHDFDSMIFNSSYKDLTRTFVHHFADT